MKPKMNAKRAAFVMDEETAEKFEILQDILRENQSGVCRMAINLLYEERGKIDNDGERVPGTSGGVTL